jgi:PD-(D/E)XK endonuclease
MIVRPYSPDQIDALAAYCAELDRCYLLPMSLATRRAVHLRLAPSRNNQLMGINWAREYEFGATLSRLHGPIAQLGERLAGSQKVAGSSPAGSTGKPPARRLSLF